MGSHPLGVLSKIRGLTWLLSEEPLVLIFYNQRMPPAPPRAHPIYPYGPPFLSPPILSVSSLPFLCPYFFLSLPSALGQNFYEKYMHMVLAWSKRGGWQTGRQPGH